MFVNISNHPSERWANKQREAAIEIGDKIADVAFPNVDPHASSVEVERLVADLVEQVKALVRQTGHIDAVLIQGEMTLVFRTVNALWGVFGEGLFICAACSERNVVENEDGTKTVRFNFVQFRGY